MCIFYLKVMKVNESKAYLNSWIEFLFFILFVSKEHTLIFYHVQRSHMYINVIPFIGLVLIRESDYIRQMHEK